MPLTIQADVLTAENPKYEGYNKDGSRYFVTAKKAAQDIKQKKPIKLSTIVATIEERSGTATKLTANNGFYSTRTKLLALRRNIVVTTSDGMRANLSEADVDTGKSVIISKAPVLVTLPSGTVHGKRMLLEQKKRRSHVPTRASKPI